MSKPQFTRPEGTGGKSVLGSDNDNPLNSLEKKAMVGLDEDKIKDYYSKKYKSTKSIVGDVREKDTKENINEIFEQDDLINNDMFDINLIESDNIAI